MAPGPSGTADGFKLVGNANPSARAGLQAAAHAPTAMEANTTSGTGRFEAIGKGVS